MVLLGVFFKYRTFSGFECCTFRRFCGTFCVFFSVHMVVLVGLFVVLPVGYVVLPVGCTRVRCGCSGFWAFLGVLLVVFFEKPSKSTTCIFFRYFWRVQKCTFSGLIVVLLGGFCKSCGFSGFKSCGFGGFLWYFSGVFSTCGSSSRLICGSSSRFLRYLWWKSPTRCI